MMGAPKPSILICPPVGIIRRGFGFVPGVMGIVGSEGGVDVSGFMVGFVGAAGAPSVTVDGRM
jgi:hypothetical protein